MKDPIVKRIQGQDVTELGHYTHVTKITNFTELYTFSGQVGTDENGKLPKELNKQIHYLFKNLRTVLSSVELTPDHVTKVNIWSVEEFDWDYFYSEYDNFFGKPSPSMTMVYVKALGLPEIKVEIDISAAK